MPRKKQKSGAPPRSHRPSGPGKAGPAPSSLARHKAGGSKQDPTAGGAIKEGSQKKQSLQANQRPIVPFLRQDRILLVGEGEHSFPSPTSYHLERDFGSWKILGSSWT